MSELWILGGLFVYIYVRLMMWVIAKLQSL